MLFQVCTLHLMTVLGSQVFFSPSGGVPLEANARKSKAA